MCVERGELRRAGDRAGRERGGEQLGPADARSAAGPRRCDTRWTRPGCASTAQQRGHRRPSPYSHTRPRSLRTRSTIITFSARSFGEEAVGGGGRALDRRRPDDVAVARAGTARATRTPRATPWPGRRTTARVRRRVAVAPARRRARRRRRRAGSGRGQARGSGSPGTRRRRAMASRIGATPARERALGRATSPRVASAARATAAGPRRRRPDVVRSGRSTASPSNGSDDRPEARATSSAARSAVTSTRSVSSRPPTTASGARSFEPAGHRHLPACGSGSSVFRTLQPCAQHIERCANATTGSSLGRWLPMTSVG